MRRGICKVLAVIHHQQHLFVAQGLQQSLQKGALRLLAHLEDPGHGRHHQLRLCEWRQFHQPDPFRVDAHKIPGHFQRQACLAQPTCPSEGE
jgi:hypothetical protein